MHCRLSYCLEKGIRSLKDLKYLKEESDYEKIGLAHFEKLKLKDAIASLHTVDKDDGELRGHESLHMAATVINVSCLCICRHKSTQNKCD